MFFDFKVQGVLSPSFVCAPVSYWSTTKSNTLVFIGLLELKSKADDAIAKTPPIVNIDPFKSDAP